MDYILYLANMYINLNMINKFIFRKNIYAYITCYRKSRFLNANKYICITFHARDSNFKLVLSNRCVCVIRLSSTNFRELESNLTEGIISNRIA